ncbi:unnamed protein product [Schistosoma margrebowiei]|uniref:Uncharacterized protein n=1 Tax=Schistosoma margrebowiei TaxID=48269 RepID=A0A183MDN8_9TREM|nr:unnamed protein product [Schistosoma margrebowiei]
MILTLNKQFYELNAAYLPFNYRWPIIPYMDDDDDGLPQRRLPSISSLSHLHKRGPELIIPFISGGVPAKKSDID